MDPQLGSVIFRKRKGTRRMSIRVHPLKGVSVSVPYLVPYAAAQAFFMLKREWVIQGCKFPYRADQHILSEQADGYMPSR